MAEISDSKEKITSMSLKELAVKYNVCRKTFKKWLTPFADYIGKPNGGYIYSPEQVRKIIEKLGLW